MVISSKDSVNINRISTHDYNTYSVNIIYSQYGLQHLGVVGEENGYDALGMLTQTTHLIPDVFLFQHTAQESRKKRYTFYFLLVNHFQFKRCFYNHILLSITPKELPIQNITNGK